METDNTVLIANAIFTKDPGPINSIQLELEEETSCYAMSNVDSFIEEILCNILYHGIIILFNKEMLVNKEGSSDICITKSNFTLLMTYLRTKEVDLLQEYTKSFGYKIKFTNNIYDGFEKIY